MTRDEIITLAANGNKAAEHFLRAYVARAHFLDDLQDGDNGKPDIVGAEADWLMAIAGNPFFEQHKNMLVPVMLCGLNAWADSNAMGQSVEKSVIKGIWHETVYAVAFITGGFAHMRQVSAHREYDIELDVPRGTKGVPCMNATPRVQEDPNGTLR